MLIRTFYLNERKTVCLRAYLLDRIGGISFTDARPAVLICPGGGYTNVSDREAEPIAMQFLARGFHAFVLTYSVHKRHPQPLINAAWALANIRTRAKEYRINPEQIAVVGFSAGGHLAGHLASTWQDPMLSRHVGMPGTMFRPNAAVLCYPVISAVTKPHEGSFQELLGPSPSREKQLEVSLEYRVTSSMPPTFLWHTATDDCVPAENSLVLARACVAHKVPCELHLYDEGPHGMSDCSRATAYTPAQNNPHCAEWLPLAMTFLEKYMRG